MAFEKLPHSYPIDDNDDAENVFDEQCCFWSDGTSNDGVYLQIYALLI